jgi:mono/diheme cytochrome c family protein
MTRQTIRRTVACGAVLAFVALPIIALAQARPVVSGKEMFHMYCAACHGESAKGDGPVGNLLKKPPADLTQIAKRNNGTFSTDMVVRIIDGRDPVSGHGGGDMPVWGDAFDKTHDPTPTEEKIRGIANYLESLQVK